MHVFVYGTLVFPEVRDRVLAGRPRTRPAVVAGFARHALRGEVYPAAVAAPGAEIAGLVLLDVSGADVSRLDAFEGDAYERVRAEARGGEGGELPVELYVLSGAHRDRLLPGGWDPEAFRAGGLARFLAGYPGFATGRTSAAPPPPSP